MSENNENQNIGKWDGDFGIKYTIRNKIYPEKLIPFFKEIFTDELKKSGVKRILEAGCNRGHNLVAISYCGEFELYGFDINPYSILLAREYKEISFTLGDIFNILYKDEYFDLVFTAGVLIHINPDLLEDALKEIFRVTKKYYLMLEYNYDFEEFEKKDYRENVGLWRGNFKKFVLDHFNVNLITEGTVGREEGFGDTRQYYLFEKNIE